MVAGGVAEVDEVMVVEEIIKVDSPTTPVSVTDITPQLSGMLCLQNSKHKSVLAETSVTNVVEWLLSITTKLQQNLILQTLPTITHPTLVLEQTR